MLSFPNMIDMRLHHFIWNGDEERWSLELRSYDSPHAWRVLKTFHKRPTDKEIQEYKNLVNKVLAAYLDGVKVSSMMPFSYSEENRTSISHIPMKTTKDSQDPVVEQVVDKLRTRSAIGVEKYGANLTREDLSKKEWLQHLQEELLDGAGYLQVLLNIESVMSNPD